MYIGREWHKYGALNSIRAHILQYICIYVYIYIYIYIFIWDETETALKKFGRISRYINTRSTCLVMFGSSLDLDVSTKNVSATTKRHTNLWVLL